MYLRPINDKFEISWNSHIDDAKKAFEWCQNSFGSGWGNVELGVPNWTGFATHLFTFHKLSHANWFKIRFT